MLIACQPEPEKGVFVSEEKFGEEWPFTVPGGRLVCDGNAVFFYVGEDIYAINGTAMTLGDVLHYKWKRPDEIWRLKPNDRDAETRKRLGMAPAYVSLGAILEKGQELCQPNSFK